MPKTTRLIALAILSIAAHLFAFSEQDENPKSNKKPFSIQQQVDIKKHSQGWTGRNHGLDKYQIAMMATSDKVLTTPYNAIMDNLLVTDKLSDFSEGELSRLINLCQNKTRQGSDTACIVLQHWNELVSKRDKDQGELEAIWLETEKNAGMGLEEKSEMTPLNENQITQASGGEADDLEAIVHNLEDGALNDPSPDKRKQTIQDIISMKDASLVAILENAMHDENLENSQLAAEGVRQLRGLDQNVLEVSAENRDSKLIYDAPHYSLADVTN